MLCFRLGKKLTPLLLRASPYEQANSPRSEQLLPDVGRVAHDDIEAALGEDFGKAAGQSKALGWTAGSLMTLLPSRMPSLGCLHLVVRCGRQ